MIRTTVLLLLLAGLSYASPKAKAAKEIIDQLNDPSKYDKEIFPKESGPIDVGVNMYLRGLELDDVNMRMKSDLTFRMMWRDSRLTYSEPGVQNVRFADYSKFWLPDPFFKGSIETRQLKTVHPEAYIGVDRRGNITFSTRFHITSKCVMDLRRFPHDSQKCSIKVASYGFAKDDMVFRFESGGRPSPMVVTKTLSIANYVMEKYEPNSCDSKTSTGDYSCLVVDLYLKRNFSTYLVEWYLPCICFVVIAFFSELISVDALLPRLALTVGPLLALTASSISYSATLASVAYTTALDVFTGISLITIFVLCLHVIVGHYFATKVVKEEDPAKASTSDEESATKLQKMKSKFIEKGDYWIRISLISFYGAFLFLYFLAYSV